ncbi:uncharacterized protein [Apostichopus japonicus]|uniref:uncharacterized protein isoform X3 n=1 Tax=Stichopus japonicus TaxID=307972 RepID=UPI003AB79646
MMTNHFIHHIPSSLHPMPGAGYGSVDVLTPQYDGESWSARNARLLAIRKERSRDAARSRRGKENFEFYELAKLLPLPAAITSQLDKASIIRLSISYLRMRDFALQGDPVWHQSQPSSYGSNNTPRISRSSTCLNQGSIAHEGTSPLTHELFENNLGANILQALDGFLFNLCSDGRFLYISETVSIYLGLSQVELTGSSIFDFVHQGDHTELAEELGMKLPPRLCGVNHSKKEEGDSVPSSPNIPSPTTSHEGLSMALTAKSTGYERSFLVRMKSTLTKRGVNFRSSGYKVIHITGSLRPRVNPAEYNTQNPEILGFVGLAVALPPPTFNELKLEPTCFVCKVGVDFKITYCDDRMVDFLDYTVSEVIGRNLYSFLHAQDVKSMRHRHLDMLSKGQTMTGYFRWMCKNGGYVWMQATAILLIAKNTNDSAFIFIMQVISEMEYRSVKMDLRQLSPLATSSNDKSKTISSLEDRQSPEKKDKADSNPAVVSTTNSKDTAGHEQQGIKRKQPVIEEHKQKKRKTSMMRKDSSGDQKVADIGTIQQPFSEKCQPSESNTTSLDASKCEKVKGIGLKMSKKLETFDYQNNNNLHNSDEVLKVPNVEKFLVKKRPHSPHGKERFGNSLPSSPTSSLRNFHSDSEKGLSERQTSSIDLPVNEYSSRNRGPFPVVNDFSKNSPLSKDVQVNTSEVFLYQKSGLPSESTQIPSRDSFYSSSHPFMFNSTQGQYSPMAFPPFGQFSSLQQYGLASRGYHPSSFSNSPFLKGYQNPHDIPMDLSYSNLASYATTPIPIMHTGVTPSSTNSFPPASRRQLSNGENHNSILSKSTDLHQLKS